MLIDNELVGVTDAARTLGFSVQHTRLLIRQGQLEGIKMGRDWIITRESLNLFRVRRSTQPLLAERKPGRRPTRPDWQSKR